MVVLSSRSSASMAFWSFSNSTNRIRRSEADTVVESESENWRVGRSIGREQGKSVTFKRVQAGQAETQSTSAFGPGGDKKWYFEIVVKMRSRSFWSLGPNVWRY